MNTPRLPALDGLRGVAILLVVGSHFISQKIPGGFGVTLFFFISGFIITRMLLDDARPWPFYVRRFFRLAPALVVLVLVVGLATTIAPGDAQAALFYYANYHSFRTPGLDVTWSLAIEEHFYLLFPALVLWLSPRRLQHFLVVFVCALLAWRLILVFGLGEIERIHRSSDTRLDSIAFGCLLSVLAARPEHRRWVDLLASRAALAVAGFVLLACFLVRNEAMRETIRYSLQGLAFMPIFAALFLRPGRRMPLEWRPLIYLGTISYSLYLYHGIGLAFGIESKALAFAAGIVATLVSFYFVETPMRRFGSRLARVRPAKA